MTLQYIVEATGQGPIGRYSDYHTPNHLCRSVVCQARVGGSDERRARRVSDSAGLRTMDRAIGASLDVVRKGPFIRMVYLGVPQVVATVRRWSCGLRAIQPF